ncbi:MAG TPA: methyltransferase domain-containing protein [Pirellulaceae bacterium]|jgi:SAM-dependent methyltransferase|nr:methyltransferase domain-containing protein [Pirellulaceae bacterium]
MRGSFEAQRELHDRLRGARSRALRMANVASASRVLEIGCGFAFMLTEWLERTQATITLVDVDPPEEPRRASVANADRVRLLQADARTLPFAEDSFDLAFAQCVLMWLGEADRRLAVREAARTLSRGGYFVAIEPDYRSLAVDPDPHGLHEVAQELLTRAGADAQAGRSLPRLFEAAGLETGTLLFDRIEPASPNAAALLFDLARTGEERDRLQRVSRWIAEERPTLHLPFWIAIGRKQIGS